MTPDEARKATQAHIARVGHFLCLIGSELSKRAFLHDASKLESPEWEMFQDVTEKLNGLTYGSPEYEAQRKEMLDSALGHHYEHNRHHPEHFNLYKCPVCKSILKADETWLPNINDHPPRLCGKCCPVTPIYECEVEPYTGIEGMNLVDLMEMMCDWMAAVERHADGDIDKSIAFNTKRFGLTAQTACLLKNTADMFREMGAINDSGGKQEKLQG